MPSGDTLKTVPFAVQSVRRGGAVKIAVESEIRLATGSCPSLPLPKLCVTMSCCPVKVAVTRQILGHGDGAGTGAGASPAPAGECASQSWRGSQGYLRIAGIGIAARAGTVDDPSVLVTVPLPLIDTVRL